MKKAWVLSFPLSAQRRLWSNWADLSLRWAHSYFVGFVMSRLTYTTRWSGNFYWVLLVLMRNLTQRRAYGGDKPCITLISDDEKPYIWIFSCCWRPLLWYLLCYWETLQIDLLLLVKNLTMRPTNSGDKPYTEALRVVTNLSLVLSHASEKLYGGEKPYTWGLLMVTTNLTLGLAIAGDKSYWTCEWRRAMQKNKFYQTGNVWN